MTSEEFQLSVSPRKMDPPPVSAPVLFCADIQVLLKRKNDLVFLFSESIHSQPMSAQHYVGVNTGRRAAFQKVYVSAHLPENEEERIALVKEKLLEALRLLYEKGYQWASSRSDSAFRFCSPL